VEILRIHASGVRILLGSRRKNLVADYVMSSLPTPSIINDTKAKDYAFNAVIVNEQVPPIIIGPGNSRGMFIIPTLVGFIIVVWEYFNA
jgi:hypothetical protein